MRPKYLQKFICYSRPIIISETQPLKRTIGRKAILKSENLWITNQTSFSRSVDSCPVTGAMHSVHLFTSRHSVTQEGRFETRNVGVGYKARLYNLPPVFTVRENRFHTKATMKFMSYILETRKLHHQFPHASAQSALSTGIWLQWLPKRAFRAFSLKFPLY